MSRCARLIQAFLSHVGLILGFHHGFAYLLHRFAELTAGLSRRWPSIERFLLHVVARVGGIGALSGTEVRSSSLTFLEKSLLCKIHSVLVMHGVLLRARWLLN